MPFFHKSKSSVGIDIGTTAIKLAELTPAGKETYRLSNYGLLETGSHLKQFNNALQSSELKPLDSTLISYLSVLKKKLKLQTNEVIASLPAFTAFTTLLELPMMSAHKTTESVGVHAQNYIPLPITTVTLDWIKVGEKSYPDGSKKQQVFLVSIPNEKIASYNEIFSAAGFKLAGFEVENISSARALTLHTKEPTLVMDIGGRSSAFSVAQDGQIKFSGQTDFSSGSLTQALSTALNIGAPRADDLKKSTTIIGGQGEHELSTVLIPIIDVIIKEANRIRQGFEDGYNQKVAGIILSGSGANMPGFESYLSGKMGLPVSVADPLKNIGYLPELEPISKKLGATLTVAIGLALKKYQHRK